MTNEDIKKLGRDDLKKSTQTLKQTLFEMRFQNAIGRLGSSGALKKSKKTLARVLTQLNALGK